MGYGNAVRLGTEVTDRFDGSEKSGWQWQCTPQFWRNPGSRQLGARPRQSDRIHIQEADGTGRTVNRSVGVAAGRARTVGGSVVIMMPYRWKLLPDMKPLFR